MGDLGEFPESCCHPAFSLVPTIITIWQVNLQIKDLRIYFVSLCATLPFKQLFFFFKRAMQDEFSRKLGLLTMSYAVLLHLSSIHNRNQGLPFD